MFNVRISEYWKGVVAAIGAAAVTVQAVVSDGVVSTDEWGIIGAAVAAFVGVVAAKNEPAA